MLLVFLFFILLCSIFFFFFFQAEDGIRDLYVTGVQTCALPISNRLLAATKSPARASLISGTIFGALHWPNPVLVPITWIGGTVMSWLFARERNILPLTVFQAI